MMVLYMKQENGSFSTIAIKSSAFPYNSTVSQHFKRPSSKTDMNDFYIGLCLAILSSVFIGTSFIIKKLGLLRVTQKSAVRAGRGGYGYLQEWLWWTGMILMIVGEFSNFAAYAFAPATLVTPLGALSVLVSAILASYVLKERLNLLGKVGCLLCVLGSTVMVIHSPKEQEVDSINQLKSMVLEPAFIIYSSLMVLLALFLIIHTAPRFGSKNVLVYIGICSSLGSFTVMGCKGVGVGIKETIRGENQFTNWVFYVLLSVVFICILIQLNYLNRALDSFNTAVVIPIYYVFFTSAVIAASTILYKEWGMMSAVDILGNLCGFITIIIGIFVLNAFKKLNISILNLYNFGKGCVDDGILSENNNTMSSYDNSDIFLEDGPVDNQKAEVPEVEYRDN